MEREGSPSQLRGSAFEQRVLSALQKLEQIGFARQIKLQDRVRDVDGHVRKIDISCILCTLVIDLRLSIECKSRERALSLDDVNQIKVFKRELPERNLFWLVVEGPVGTHVLEALKRAGISIYQIDDLESIINDIHAKYNTSGIESLRQTTRMLSMMSPFLYGQAAASLRIEELKLLSDLKDVHAAISNCGSYYSERIYDSDD
jgi:hypothetical protein